MSPVRLASLKDLIWRHQALKAEQYGRSKRIYIFRSIIKSVKFYFKNPELNQSFHRFILPFVNIYGGSRIGHLSLPPCEMMQIAN